MIVGSWSASIRSPGELAVLVALSLFTYFAAGLWIPAFQIDVSVVLALAAIILDGPLAGLLVLAIPELVRSVVERHHVRRIATASNLASFACEVLAAQVLLVALPLAHTTVIERWLAYAVVATVMELVNFLVTRGIIAGLVDRTLISGWRLELGVLGACLALAPFAALTASLLPVLGILALVAVAGAEASLSVLVRLVTWTPRADGLTVPEARTRYAAALARRTALSRAQRRVLLAAARSGTRRPSVRLSRAADRDRIAKTLILAGLWTGQDDCFSRLQPAEMPIESRLLVVAHGWAELTASGTEQLEHRLALLTLHNNPRRYDRRIVATARGLIPESQRETRVPYVRGLPRRIAQLKLVA
jgi:hypothetical protein